MLWAGVPVLLFIHGMTLGKLLNFFEPPCAFKMGSSGPSHLTGLVSGLLKIIYSAIEKCHRKCEGFLLLTGQSRMR